MTFGSGLKSICTSSFYGNKILTDVYCLAEEVPEAITNDYYKIYKMFGNTVYDNATLHVPAKLIDAYKSAEGWKYFKNIVTIETPKYSLTYNIDGEEYKSLTLEEGDPITPEPYPTKEGYTFSGWSEIPTTMPANDVTITGTFIVNKYTITYMVDNALLMTEEVDYGTTISPPKSQREGYEILWNSHPTTMPAYDITNYGSYIATGINSVYANEVDRQVFTPDGILIQRPKKGLNIMRMSNGKIKKVIVK